MHRRRSRGFRRNALTGDSRTFHAGVDNNPRASRQWALLCGMRPSCAPGRRRRILPALNRSRGGGGRAWGPQLVLHQTTYQVQFFGSGRTFADGGGDTLLECGEDIRVLEGVCREPLDAVELDVASLRAPRGLSGRIGWRPDATAAGRERRVVGEVMSGPPRKEVCPATGPVPDLIQGQVLDEADRAPYDPPIPACGYAKPCPEGHELPRVQDQIRLRVDPIVRCVEQILQPPQPPPLDEVLEHVIEVDEHAGDPRGDRQRPGAEEEPQGQGERCRYDDVVASPHAMNPEATRQREDRDESERTDKVRDHGAPRQRQSSPAGLRRRPCASLDEWAPIPQTGCPKRACRPLRRGAIVRPLPT